MGDRELKGRIGRLTDSSNEKNVVRRFVGHLAGDSNIYKWTRKAHAQMKDAK